MKIEPQMSVPDDEYIFEYGKSQIMFESVLGLLIDLNRKWRSADNVWFELVDLEAGPVTKKSEQIFKNNNASRELQHFSELRAKRNRIAHAFRIKNEKGEQSMQTRDRKTGDQFEITEQYLNNFMQECNDVYTELDKLR